jgi:hypothetical protein
LGFSNRPYQKSLGSVAAIGFLLGVLSFLCALSHLEKITHRPTNCSSNLNHLSHLERVLYNWPTSHMQSSTMWPQQPMGKIDTAFQHVQQWQVTYYFSIRQHRIDSHFGSQGCVTKNPCRGQHRFKLFRQRMYQLSQNEHRYTPFGSEYARGFLCRGQTSSPQTVGVEWSRNPHHGSSQPFICMGQG